MPETPSAANRPAFHRDLVASALHALADLIDNRDVDRQLIEFDPDELRQHAAMLEAPDDALEDRETQPPAADPTTAPLATGSAPLYRPRLQEALSSAMRHLGPRSSGELIYASPTGARWTLVCDGTTKRMVVWHVPNAASGGQASETELAAFLARESDAPEHVALRKLLKDA